MTSSLSATDVGAPGPWTLPSESDVDKFWEAGRMFATGVSVVTLGFGERVHGATVSAFTVVSRRPALISLCARTSVNTGPKKPGPTPTSGLVELITEHRAFAVNILGRGQAGLARHFADPARGNGAGQFVGVPWVPGFEAGVPLLDGALCWLWCRLRRVVPVGDHQVVVAGVAAAKIGEGTPLLYFAGKLHPGFVIPEEVEP